jgi:hypothetical protein
MLAERIQQIPVGQVQANEIWTFVQKKEGHKWANEENAEKIGDAYTFIALERSTKLVLAWHLGKRDTPNTIEFIRKLRAATFEDRFEFCTDAFGSYLPAVSEALYDRADYNQVVCPDVIRNPCFHWGGRGPMVAVPRTPLPGPKATLTS